MELVGAICSLIISRQMKCDCLSTSQQNGIISTGTQWVSFETNKQKKNNQYGKARRRSD